MFCFLQIDRKWSNDKLYFETCCLLLSKPKFRLKAFNRLLFCVDFLGEFISINTSSSSVRTSDVLEIINSSADHSETHKRNNNKNDDGQSSSSSSSCSWWCHICKMEKIIVILENEFTDLMISNENTPVLLRYPTDNYRTLLSTRSKLDNILLSKSFLFHDILYIGCVNPLLGDNVRSHSDIIWLQRPNKNSRFYRNYYQ